MSEFADSQSRIDQVGRSGIYPASGPAPSGAAPVRGQAEFGHPEEHRRLLPPHAADHSGLLIALGRAVYGGYFLYNGINHFVNRRMMTDYARSKGVQAPGLAVGATGALMGLGGLSVIAGIRPATGAAMIAAFLLGVSPKMHDFWRVDDQQQRTNEMTNFTKNLALLGAALLMAGASQAPSRRA